MKKTMMFLGSLALAASIHAATYYVNVGCPNDNGDGLQWATAKQTLQAALDLSVDGDTVIVTNGTYAPFTCGGQAVSIRSVNGASATTIDGQLATCCADFGSSTNAVLTGFTLQNGYTWQGGGVCGGTVNQCIILNNVAYSSGGGAYDSVLNHCYILNNESGSDGGGTYYGTLNNCLVAKNVAGGSGGGVCYSTLYQCTVVGNQATMGTCGGAYGATGYNSIFWGNTGGSSSGDYGANFYNGYMEYSCAVPLQAGEGNIAVDPCFVATEDKDYRLRVGSSCLDKGGSNYVFSVKDLLAGPRIQNAAVDMGAFEGSVAISLSAPTNVVASDGTYPDAIRITWSPVTDAVRYRVYRSERKSGKVEAVSGWQATLSFDDVPAYQGRTYWYWVKAARDLAGLDKSAFSLSDSGSRAFEPKWFVNALKPNNDGDGLSWVTAKQTIQAAVDLAGAGDSIAVAEGVYQPFSTTNKVVSIRGVNGAAVTIVDGGNAMCCAYIGDNVGDTDVFLYGLTLRNGNAWIGGGAKGGTLENCALTDNDASSLGGGACDSILVQCVLSNNWASQGGGVASSVMGNTPSCVLEDCLIVTNQASYGGGVFRCSATGCEIRGNVASSNGGGAAGDALVSSSPNCLLTDCLLTNNVSNFGGGADLCMLTRCRVAGNAAPYGGGIMDCVADRCTLIGNRAFSSDVSILFSDSGGGGACNGTLKNCLIVGNSAYYGGGVATYMATQPGSLQNCTVVGNTADYYGGGLWDNGGYGFSINNSIIFGNHSYSEENYMLSGWMSFTNSCSSPLPSGLGNISVDPLFVDAAHGNYRLMPDSPCIGAGSNIYASGETDLSGLARIIGGSVDMGAYEYAPLAYVLDSTNVVWTTGGASSWFGQGEVVSDGDGAAQSGAISDAQNVWIQALAEGKGTLHFAWRDSSESGRDYLRVYVDGQPANAISGETGWQTVTLSITNFGSHAIRWEYAKGKSGSAGQDAAWLDHVAWQPVMADVVAFVDPAAGGSVSGGGAHAVGSSVTLVAIPNRGWRFDRWDDGETNARRTLVVPEGRCICTAYFVPNAISLAEALDNAGQTWSTSGDAGWAGWALVSAYDAEDSAQSGAVGDQESSSLSTTVTGPGTMSFWWRVSCEENYDYLDFSVDGGIVDWLTGESGWRQVTLSVGEGTHRLEWSYSKDEADADGDDAAWVDQFVWTSVGPAITREPLDAAVAQGESAELDVSATGTAPLSYQWFLGASGQTVQPIASATNRIFITPTITTNTTYWVRVSDVHGVVASQMARVRIGYAVGTLADLQKIGSGIDGWTLDAAYRMTSDIDASATAVWNDAATDVSSLEGFAPIGGIAAPFTGTFDGRGHIVRLLAINRDDRDGVGLFGCVGTEGCVANVGVVGGRRSGYGQVGGLVGQNKGTVVRSFAVGVVEGVWAVGGLVGENNGTVEDAYAQGTASGLLEVGGWVGYNDATLSRGYTVVAVTGEKETGGLVGANWGTVEDAYWNTEVSGLTESAGGTGRTTIQMRQASTFAGWALDSTWGIQEGIGSPFLTVVAQGRTAHQSARPTAVFPTENTFVWSPRPTLTGNVSEAGADVVDAHWQVAKGTSFTDAIDWTEQSDWNGSLPTSFGSRVPVGQSLIADTFYYWRVRVQCGYGKWTDWSIATKFLVLRNTGYIESGKNKLSTWSKGLQASKWEPDDLQTASEDFDTAILLDGENIEAHIYRATTTLLALSENQNFRDLLAAFGYGFDESLFTMTGTWTGVASPLPNETVDRTAVEALPAIKSALTDLSVVPTNWTETVEISMEDFPVDETVYLDQGDVLYARALLNAAQAAILIAQGYDLTADYSKTNETDYVLSAPKGTPLAVALDGDESEWANVPVALYGYAAQIEYVKIAQTATNVYLLVHLADGIAPSYFGGWMNSTLGEQNVFGYGLSEGVEWMQGNVHVLYRGCVMEILVDLAPEQQGEPYSLDDVWIDYRDVITSEWGWDEAYFDKKNKPVRELIADHPALMNTVRNPDKLAMAKGFLDEALKGALVADAAVQSRTDGLMHFFEYDPEQAAEQAELRQRLNEAKRSMDAPQHIVCAETEGDVYLGAFFEAPYLPRSLLPDVTDDDEIIGGTFPDPTAAGLLPGMTQALWQERLEGHVPFVVTNAFTLGGHAFTTGGYGFWAPVSESLGQTNYVRSGTPKKAYQSSWAETTVKGPGTLTFSWAVSSRERVDTLSVWVDGVRQTNAVSGEAGWGPRQIELSTGTHTVRWCYYVSDVYYGYYEASLGTDAGYLRDVSWSGATESFTTTTPVPVPHVWLDGFSGLVVDGNYESVANADPDHDGMPTWQEYVAGTSPTNAESVLQATLTRKGSELVVGWTPDLSPARVYTVDGKVELTDPEWIPTNAATHFYRVKVEMP